MSDINDKQLPDQIVELVVGDILKKNGIDLDKAKRNISEEQKQMMRELVKDLTQRVNNFVNNPESQDSNKKP